MPSGSGDGGDLRVQLVMPDGKILLDAVIDAAARRNAKAGQTVVQMGVG